MQWEGVGQRIERTDVKKKSRHLSWERHILHIDYVTAILGAPVILWLVLRRLNLGDLA